jgi:hypothetical protein
MHQDSLINHSFYHSILHLHKKNLLEVQPKQPEHAKRERERENFCAPTLAAIEARPGPGTAAAAMKKHQYDPT